MKIINPQPDAIVGCSYPIRIALVKNERLAAMLQFLHQYLGQDLVQTFRKGFRHESGVFTNFGSLPNGTRRLSGSTWGRELDLLVESVYALNRLVPKEATWFLEY
jgi:hypothetical protein